MSFMFVFVLHSVLNDLSAAVPRQIQQNEGQWVERQTRNPSVVSSKPIKGSRCFLSKKLYHHCLVLVGSKNGLNSGLHEQNCFLTIKLISISTNYKSINVSRENTGMQL